MVHVKLVNRCVYTALIHVGNPPKQRWSPVAISLGDNNAWFYGGCSPPRFYNGNQTNIIAPL